MCRLGVGQCLSGSVTLLSAEMRKDCSIPTRAPHQAAFVCTLTCQLTLQAPNACAAVTMKWLMLSMSSRIAVLLPVLHNDWCRQIRCASVYIFCADSCFADTLCVQPFGHSLYIQRERERERLQCFSQPASLITYRRRQRSNVQGIKTV